MDETPPEVDIWEFEAMVDAAVFSALYHEQTENTFRDQVFAVYNVIERRVREAENTVLVGVPDNSDKEAEVKSIAERLEDGFDSPERLASAKDLYENVPHSINKNPFENVTPYWERDEFDPYS